MMLEELPDNDADECKRMNMKMYFYIYSKEKKILLFLINYLYN